MICMVYKLPQAGVCLIAVASDFVKVYWLDAIVGDGVTGAVGLEHAHDPNEPGPAVALDHRLQPCRPTQIVDVARGARAIAASAPNPG